MLALFDCDGDINADHNGVSNLSGMMHIQNVECALRL